MNNVYTDAEYLAAYKQRSKLLGWFIAITVIYLAFCIGWLIYHISLPYKDAMDWLPQTCVYVVSAIYVIFAFVYMGIPFDRANRYYNMLTNLSTGMKDVETNYFYNFEELFMQKNNVDMVGCIFETWSKKKCEWMDRAVYFDKERELPDFENGDYVRYVVHSNIVLQYEILEKHALEFEEVDDEEFLAQSTQTTPTAEEIPAKTENNMENTAETPVENTENQ